MLQPDFLRVGNRGSAIVIFLSDFSAIHAQAALKFRLLCQELLPETDEITEQEDR